MQDSTALYTHRAKTGQEKNKYHLTVFQVNNFRIDRAYGVPLRVRPCEAWQVRGPRDHGEKLARRVGIAESGG